MLLEKTRKALERIITAFEEGRLGAMGATSCVYAQDCQRCAIGCLLSEETLEEMRSLGMNENTPVHHLYEALPGTREETGLTAAQANVLQGLHDDWATAPDEFSKAQEEERFIGGIKRVLSGEITHLSAYGTTASFHDDTL